MFQPPALGRLRGGEAVGTATYIDRRHELDQMRRAAPGLFTHVDLLVTPTIPLLPIAIAEAQDDQAGTALFARNTRPFNAYGLPACPFRAGSRRTVFQSACKLSGRPGERSPFWASAHAFEQRTVSECLDFSRAVSEAIARTDPRSYTTAFAKAGRERKIPIDYLRNNRTNTSVCAFSPRARPGAAVSMPLDWDELDEPRRRWTLLTVPRRLSPGGSVSTTQALRTFRRRRSQRSLNGCDSDPWTANIIARGSTERPKPAGLTEFVQCHSKARRSDGSSHSSSWKGRSPARPSRNGIVKREARSCLSGWA